MKHGHAISLLAILPIILCSTSFAPAADMGSVETVVWKELGNQNNPFLLDTNTTRLTFGPDALDAYRHLGNGWSNDQKKNAYQGKRSMGL